MNNAQEIYKSRIEEAAEFDSEYAGMLGDAFESGANFILSHLWISVEEALPEEDNLYFVLVDSIHPRVTDFDGEKWSGYRNITHWMPIPSLEGGEK